MRTLILGASGMLGSAVFRVFRQDPRLRVRGTVREAEDRIGLGGSGQSDLAFRVNADDLSTVRDAFEAFAPNIVINCIGVVKQLESAQDPLVAIPINSLLPHRLAVLCREHGARLVHISTDCVFSGRKGCYLESDHPDATDLYGRSKLLGEVTTSGCLTLRTSIIGPEPSGRASGLLGWFLAQSGPVRGYRKAVFSGLPTVALAELIREHVLPRSDLEGLYHVGASPIDKYSLLALIRAQWNLGTQVDPHDTPEIDRSLDCSRFSSVTGFEAPSWPELIRRMHAFG